MELIKIYRDSGADTTALKPYSKQVEYYQFPYDSAHRPKKQKIKLAIPSEELTWQDAHVTWEEMDFPLSELVGSSILYGITKIVGKSNRQDILHLDSAYKSKCDIFITSDKDDIYSKKALLEPVCKFKIFYHHDSQEIIDYLETLIN